MRLPHEICSSFSSILSPVAIADRVLLSQLLPLHSSYRLNRHVQIQFRVPFQLLSQLPQADS